jgi:pfkB family carbohydrate kinase
VKSLGHSRRRIEAVDGTAAGDAFCAASVVTLLDGEDGADALRRACAAGALAASRPGAQPSLAGAAEADEALADSRQRPIDRHHAREEAVTHGALSACAKLRVREIGRYREG